MLSWYEDHKRDLPWRHTTDPYKIWLSEIILQQTRVVQGHDYYMAFISKYPTIIDLAVASEDEILALWSGLGYYSRARNLHASAKYIVENFDGIFPRDYQDILNLKGVGKYTAAAISSFAYGKVYPVVDGNVIRVISRLYGILDAVDDTKVLKSINEIASTLIDPDHPDKYNQAIMELGAIQCTIKSPACNHCPMVAHCVSLDRDLIEFIPLKAKKLKRTYRYFHYFIFDMNGSTILHRRNSKDIWQGLFEFPLIEKENDDDLSDEEIESLSKSMGIRKLTIVRKSERYLQKLTHRDIHVLFYHIEYDNDNFTVREPYLPIAMNKVLNFALPKVIVNYLS